MILFKESTKLKFEGEVNKNVFLNCESLKISISNSFFGEELFRNGCLMKWMEKGAVLLVLTGKDLFA